MRVRGLAASLVLLLTASLAACAPALPETVVPGTTVVVGWPGEFTSANAAAAPTAGNAAIAETTRGEFGDVVDGDFVADESFGLVTIVKDDPFTVRYDVAEPAWSDGIPLDAADLLLGWAAASGYLVTEDATAGRDSEADAAAPVPRIDEFARAIEVRFGQPIMGWQRAVEAAVPAHVVGRRAFGADDAMEAKQLVIRAIQDGDRAALEAIAAVWNDGFDVSAGDDIDAELLLSSGPFLVESVAGEEKGGAVTLVPNPAYRGPQTPKVSRVELVPPGEQPVADLADRLDVAVLPLTTADRGPIRELERQDYAVNTSHDGSAWNLQLNASGIFGAQPARAAFIRAASAADMVARGSGLWGQAYTGTASMLSAPGTRAYEIVIEDSGFTVALGTPADDPDAERERAGVSRGSAVCVLYDRASEFAVGAFWSLRDAAAEAGWNVVDCGSDDVESALAQRGWDAVIARTPVPQTAEQIAAQWGSAGAASLTGLPDPERDDLIAQYAQSVDVYEAREVLAQIESTIVRAAVALPLALSPLVTVSGRGVSGVTTPDGAGAGVIADAVQWEAVP
ncbi:hypothetical protein [uncultured Microbacterium sp.]|uniref:hypothetical protein n=1 Tax=uncultured Microbacterium sp. TaxID=191216 RepID=UPI0028D46BE5|nr:hypothetical protein [uncultured Microbacterium sp.]